MGSIYTKKGDKGETGLFGGSRISKDDLRVECYGTIDEANSNLGLAYCLIKDEELKSIIRHIQNKLFVVGAELASDEKGLKMLAQRVSEEDVEYLEKTIDKYQELVGPQKGFIIPGTTEASAVLHMARTIIRRAERKIVTLKKEEYVTDTLIKYINRLSDTLFMLARGEAHLSFVQEVKDKVVKKLTEEKLKAGINLELAKKMAEKAQHKASELKVPIVFSVVDEGGNLLLMHRMEGSLLASVDISINKAYTALSLKMPTDKLAALVQPGGALYGIQSSNNNRIVTFGGGLPIECDNKVIGGIGVSGGTVEQDMEVAQYVLLNL